jgi:hypothetical protein
VAGAIAFAAGTKVITGINPVVALACGVLVAGGVHLAKSAVVRPFVTATTAGVGNTPVSIAEDVTSTAVSVTAVIMPILILVLGGILLLVLVWWITRPSSSPGRAPNA